MGNSFSPKTRQMYNSFAREERKMIREEYYRDGDSPLEVIRQYAYRAFKQEQEAREQRIKEIMEKANVPRWKAELYYCYSSKTNDFLYSREKRKKNNFKNEIKRYFNGDFEDECINTIDWIELYEILGPVPYFGHILDLITKILGNIAFFAKNNEMLPYIFEEQIFYSAPSAIPDFSLLNDLIKELQIMEEAMKRYILTELPQGSKISLGFFEELDAKFIRTENASGGFTHLFVDVYEYRKVLCVKTEFSYSNKKLDLSIR